MLKQIILWNHYQTTKNQLWSNVNIMRDIYFLSGFFFHEHSWFTERHEKCEAISLSPLYHLHPLHRHLDISRAITVESSPLHRASSCTRTGNLWFPGASRYPLRVQTYIDMYDLRKETKTKWTQYRSLNAATKISWVRKLVISTNFKGSSR